MADSVSNILEYLRQHHFPQAEAALKAELAGREVANGLFSIDVDLPNGDRIKDGESPVASDASELKKPGPDPQVSYHHQLANAPPLHASSYFQGDALAGGALKAEQAGEIDKVSGATLGELNMASSEPLSEGFWQQKDELLWVPGNNNHTNTSTNTSISNSSSKLGHLQLGKVHPLDEAGYSQVKKSTTNPHVDKQKVAGSARQLPASKASLESSRHESPVRASAVQSCLEELEQATLKKDGEVSKTNSISSKASSAKVELQQYSECLERSSGLPRLPPVRLKSAEKIPDEWVSQTQAQAHCRMNTEAELDIDALDASFALGSFLDVPVGQDISSSGTKRSVGSNRPSVSHGIAEDPSEFLSSFATVGDGSALDYPDDYWDSDTYENDDDPGYTRRLVEDQDRFMASEINYPSEEERERARLERSPGQQGTTYSKYDDDDRSYVESYFSGEEYYRSRDAVRDMNAQADTGIEALCGATGGLSFRPHPSDYDGQLLDPEELKQIRSEPAWQGFVVQGNAIRKDQAAATTSGNDLDREDFSREIRETYLAETSEGEAGSLHDEFHGRNGYGVASPENRLYAEGNIKEGEGTSGAEDEQDIVLQYYTRAWSQKANGREDAELLQQERNGSVETQRAGDQLGGFQFGGFSFPSPSSTGDVEGSRAESGRSLWSTREVSSRGEEAEHFANGFVGPDDTLASWKRKSNESSPIISAGEDPDLRLAHSTASPGSTDDCLSVEEPVDEEEDADAQREDTEAAAAYDEEAIAVHEHFQRLQAEEEEFETFDLKIIHRKNRTGFEEEKDFPVVINSVIAGRYHVTEYLGSAAFSKAIQAHDLHTGMDVCMKIIKNNKDFFDQSLDEIKLLKYINKHDPADKYHILRLYDYFYHREHLFIVCELLRANLYEFHKYNRDSGGEVYFTMPRLQSITRQCLEALEFLHGLGLIHCDLKPENILVKSYSRCEVKVIDLGSSCFQSDHLCSYVQSRSYRAPEVILGLPYDQKIDIWSLGCILAELCSGNVLFQNDSLSTLLARVVGIIGPLDPEMVAVGRESYKFLTKSGKLYERNQETSRLEYLVPKKTTLAHRLPMGDPGFIEFVGYLLQINPKNRPTASEAVKHPWLSYPYEPISS